MSDSDSPTFRGDFVYGPVPDWSKRVYDEFYGRWAREKGNAVTDLHQQERAEILAEEARKGQAQQEQAEREAEGKAGKETREGKEGKGKESTTTTANPVGGRPGPSASTGPHSPVGSGKGTSGGASS